MSIKTKGYHGTTDTAAASIISQNKFYISKKDIEWLCAGTYFFAHKAYATDWATREVNKPAHAGCSPVVLSVKLTYEDFQLLDLDDPTQRDQVNELIKGFIDVTASVKDSPKADMHKVEQRKKWCFACNLYRRLHKGIAITSFTFLVRDNPNGFPDTQRQFCVSDPAIISNIKKEA